MDWQLNAAEARVLGCLLEKEIATPDYYPLSLNALVNGCNQKSNREPVVNYDEAAVESTLNHLAEMGFVKQFPRQPGLKEPRWGHLMSGELVGMEAPPPVAERGPSDRERIAALEAALAELRREFEEFRKSFQ